jgi:hypothetical protein
VSPPRFVHGRFTQSFDFVAALSGRTVAAALMNAVR